MFWTFQPKREQSEKKNIPFITWECQDEVIVEIVNRIRIGGDLLIDKSREMGATWIVLGCFFYEWLFTPSTTLLCISRKQEYVDKKDNPDCLFWKLDYLLKNLPSWARPPVIDKVHRTHMHLLNPFNGSVIDGESTNSDVGAGGRRQAVMCDEFARVEAPEAAWIAETLSDTTPCRIFNSTPTSRGHPFGRIRFGGKVDVFDLPWYRHPYKRQGLYKTPDINIITILDIDYYRNLCPEVFNRYKANVPIKYSELEKELLITTTKSEAKWKLRFIADGNCGDIKPLNGYRSPWYDYETIDRDRSDRDIACNINMDYIGSGDVVFSQRILRNMLETYVFEPKISGEVIYQMRGDRITNIVFKQDYGKRRLKWWGKLAGSRPEQNHNYIIGCDISLGTGASNSVASIFDCDLNMKVGSFVCPNTSPTNFAEMVYAIGKWVGGSTDMPFLIWEANGPGQTFDRRIFQLDYYFVYATREEKTNMRTRKKTKGWYSNADNKLNLLSQYDAAMTACFNPQPSDMAFINPDKKALREAEDYIFYDGSRSGIGPSGSQEDEGSAKAAHGDRVIADALCNLARFDQKRAAVEKAPSEYGTYASRMLERKLEKLEKNENSKWLI